tara:strand:+ start:12244 stop:12546 length:303 start_codon:yes stop_codon:yes gene_type:complete
MWQAQVNRYYSGRAAIFLHYVLAYSFRFAILARLGLVAQSVEQRIENPCVGGSIPPRATKRKTVKKLNFGWAFLLFIPLILKQLDFQHQNHLTLISIAIS